MGRRALVTGGTRGIGAAISVALKNAGHDVAANYAGNSEAAEAFSNDTGIKVFKWDVGEFDACEAGIREAEGALGGPIEILVNNAGTIMRKPAAEHPDEYWDKVIDVNLSAQFILSREIGKGMIARGSGKIIFTASLLTFQGGITVPGYAASKGGIGQLTKALANEWAGKGVNVNAIAPGYIATDNTQALQDDAARSKSILERIPAGRWGTPDDFAGPAIFLASNASNYVNGEILTVDGGWMGR